VAEDETKTPEELGAKPTAGDEKPAATELPKTTPPVENKPTTASASAASVARADDRPVRKSLLTRFCEASGYKESDVVDSSEERRTFVTKNGGKYRFSKSGDVVWLSGPSTSAAVKASE
jgi:3-oxoacyl-ACP reductase-like protein